MKKLLTRFWQDQSGEASGVAMILLYSIVALGATVGLVTLRDQIVQEFGDLAVALDSLDQSWSIPGLPAIGYDDDRLFKPPITTGPDPDPAGQPPAGLKFEAPVGESPL